MYLSNAPNYSNTHCRQYLKGLDRISTVGSLAPEGAVDGQLRVRVACARIGPPPPPAAGAAPVRVEVPLQGLRRMLVVHGEHTERPPASHLDRGGAELAVDRTLGLHRVSLRREEALAAQRSAAAHGEGQQGGGLG